MTKPSQLDRDTRRSTAFSSWEAFTAQVRAGYCPTVPGNTAAERRLRAALIAAGLPVFPAPAVAR